MAKTTDPIKSRPKGRPRDENTHRAILKAALAELKKSGFRALSMDAIAATARVGKMTVYRRWPNKAALVMDAFLEIVGPETEFPEGETTLSRIQRQLQLQAKFFAGPYSEIVAALIGEAQFDEELAEAFFKRWLAPRRAMTKEILKLGVERGELKINDYDMATDLLYGPFYYRLMLKNGDLDEKFVQVVFASWVCAFGQ